MKVAYAFTRKGMAKLAGRPLDDGIEPIEVYAHIPGLLKGYGKLEQAKYRPDPIFRFEVPVEVPGVDSTLLDPRSTWSDPDRYDRKARELARMFRDNFERFDLADELRSAGPRV